MGCCSSKSSKALNTPEPALVKKHSFYKSGEDTLDIGEIRRRAKLKQGVIQKQAIEEVKEAKNAKISTPEKTEAIKRLIQKALKKHTVLSSLTEDNSQSVIMAMKLYRLNHSEVIFEQGSTGSNFYVITAGKVDIIVNRKRVKILGSGDSFGEMALIQNLPRTATVKTLEPCQLWVIDRTEFSEAMKLANSSNYEEKRAFIEGVSIFQSLSQIQRDRLVSSLTLLNFSEGSYIVREGDTGDLFYIIKDGTVSCMQNRNEIRKLYKGDYFGEQALLYSCTRTASCIAIEGEVKCLSITRENLTKVLGTSLQKIIYRNTLRIAFTKAESINKLTREQQEKIIDRMTIVSYTKGAIVIESGSKIGRSLYVIVKGSLVKGRSNEPFAELYSTLGDIEKSADDESAYTANLYAKEGSDIAIISKLEIERAIGGDVTSTTASNQVITILTKAEMFSGLSQENLHKLSSMLTLQTFHQEQVIFEQGSLDSNFYIIKDGTVDIVKDGVKIRSITKLDYFGERAIILNEPRSASVIAKSSVTCWLLTRESFVNGLSQKVIEHLKARMNMQDSKVTLDQLVPVQVVGKGNFGTVSLVAHKNRKAHYALKAVARWKITSFELYEPIMREKNVMDLLDHMFILKSIKTFKDQTHLYFLTEYVRGMDLFDVLRKIGLVTDNDARFYIASMILILEHLHDRNIVYRDLKPENLVIDESGFVKLIDFGTAKIIQGRTFTVVGTPHYMSPEIIIGKGYDFLTDYWTLGVILYEFVCGVLPFGDNLRSPYEVYEAIIQGRIQFPRHIKQPFSSQLIIEQLLSKHPASRIAGSVERLKRHRWFRGFSWEKLSNKDMKTPYVPEAVDFSAKLEASMLKPKSIKDFLTSEEINDDKSGMKRRQEPPNWDANF